MMLIRRSTSSASRCSIAPRSFGGSVAQPDFSNACWAARDGGIDLFGAEMRHGRQHIARAGIVRFERVAIGGFDFLAADQRPLERVFEKRVDFGKQFGYHGSHSEPLERVAKKVFVVNGVRFNWLHGNRERLTTCCELGCHWLCQCLLWVIVEVTVRQHGESRQMVCWTTRAIISSCVIAKRWQLGISVGLQGFGRKDTRRGEWHPISSPCQVSERVHNIMLYATRPWEASQGADTASQILQLHVLLRHLPLSYLLRSAG